MSNPTPSAGESTAPVQASNGPARHTLRTVSILLVVLLLSGVGGWWMVQAGLLSQWLAPAAQTASSLAAGVQAQGDAAQDGAAPSAASQAAATSTGSAAVEESSATAAPEAATPSPESGTPTAVAPSLVTIPAVAGVKGSRLVDQHGALVATLESGDSVLISGRSDDGAWLVVSAAAVQGWAPARQLIAYGLQRLPIMALPAAVAAVPAAAVTSVDALPLTVVGGASSALALSATETGTQTPVAGGALNLRAVPAHSHGAVTATVVIDEGRLNLRAGPGTAYTIIGKAENGTTYTAVGRNSGGDWLQLQLAEGGAGWASAAYLEVAGVVEELGVVQVEVTPSVQAGTAQPAADAPATDAGSAITLVSTGPVSAAAAAGPAGTLVFQQSPGGMIYAYALATGDLWTVTNGFDPAISPDGSSVAFVRDGGETGLYLINIDGSNERRIFERPALSSPKWSADGQWIVFTRNDEGVECYLVSDRLCMLPDEFNKRFPLGAPSEVPLVTEYQYKLAAVDADGGNYHDVSSLNSARAADWSDAGIVYQSAAGIQITADGEGATTQTVIFDNLNPYIYDPDLQPGGGQIVFQRKGAAQTDLWVVNSDGSGLHALTQPKTTLVDTLPSNVAAAYSPDGRHIVFLSNRTDSGEAGEWHLWVMNADGSDQRRLPVGVEMEYTYGDDQVVSWGA